MATVIDISVNIIVAMATVILVTVNTVVVLVIFIVYVNSVVVILSYLLFSTGVGKVWPMGHIRPAKGFYEARFAVYFLGMGNHVVILQSTPWVWEIV